MTVTSGPALMIAGDEPVLAGPDFIAVKNPKRLPRRLAAQRVSLGEANDYKPSIGRLKDGDLLLVAFAQRKVADPGKISEYLITFRSNDGGRTWLPRIEDRAIFGREFFLTVLRDGTILMTNHILPQDINNEERGALQKGYWYSHIRRSADGGRTWETHRIGKEDGFPPDGRSTATDRRAVELPDGTVLLGVSSGPDGGLKTYMWRSKDSGKTWDKSTVCDFQGWRDIDGFFSNSETFRLLSGKLLHINRVDGSNHPIKGHPFPGRKGDDNTDRSILWESADNGVTWRNPRDFGTYGEMYPQMLRLTDGRLLCDFTVRGLAYPIGIQATISYDEGATWDFEHDRIIVESRTPKGQPSGGGYGNTIQLPDGTLVTCYSYRDDRGSTRLEVVRWRLPRR